MTDKPLTKTARKEYVRMARSLGYGDRAETALKAAKTENEAQRIMTTARKRKAEEEDGKIWFSQAKTLMRHAM